MLTEKQLNKINRVATLYNTGDRKSAILLIRNLSKVDLVGMMVFRTESRELLKQSPAQRVAFEDTVYQSLETSGQ